MGQAEASAGWRFMNRRPYVRPVSRAGWFLTHARYQAYMLRELTCVLVAVYCVLILIGLHALGSGQPNEWNSFLASQQHGAWIALHAFALVFFIIYQTTAWFGLAPKAMPLQVGGRVVPPGLIVAAHYLAWFMVTLVVFSWAGVF